MVEEIDRDGAPAAPEVEQAPRYMWTANHTAAKDAIIYRRAIAENPNAVPLRVWQFCEENGLDVCLFDGVRARQVTELEEALALSPPHAHAQIRGDGGVVDINSVDVDNQWKLPPLGQWPQVAPTIPEPSSSTPVDAEDVPFSATTPKAAIVAPYEPVADEPAHDTPDQEHSSGE